MGIHCEINLHKRSDGVFVPGSVVSGTIKYGIDAETEFERITVSLKGHGFVIIRDQQAKNRGRAVDTYRKSEDYVDIDNVVYTNEDKDAALPIGMYETQFSFRLPEEIPSSLKYCNRTARYSVRCKIEYYVRIKFERQGMFNFNKRFKKEITVASGIKPRLPTTPVIHGKQKKIFQMFSKSNTVNIKANIQNSVIPIGGKIEFTYEICNNTKHTIKGVETKLIEIHGFTTGKVREVEITRDIDGTDTKTGSLASGETMNLDGLINVPSERTSLEFSNVVAREYFLQIKAIIPFPHFNAVLKVPVQIGDIIGGDQQSLECDEPPPSYWEVMGDEKEKGDDDFD
ncbi:uncharacterized protein LOC131849469 [Achroia grisella]|uniref:uncharacterized protein LOC131849469 n=1 Tax=Achroia grisella TaxID=688607 RepID=UPI0027D3339A|nr:uncharacterized protein LOC131849469 [Achroia grisella]